MTNKTEARFDVSLYCPVCSHEWKEHLDLPMEVGAAVKRMYTWLTCPKCGNHSSNKKEEVNWITDQR